MRLLLACFLVILSFCSTARDFSRDFAVVFATESTEARFGRIPLDRALIAKAIESAARHVAKGVVVKFFLDQPRTTEGDNQLAREHTVKIRISRMRTTIGDHTLTLQAIPGRTYRVGGNAFAWIVDESNNQVVAGEKR
jgi:hypothetical protein